MSESVLDAAFAGAKTDHKIIATGSDVDKLVVGRARSRIALHIYAMTQTVTVHPNAIAVVGQGFLVTPTMPLHITQREFGPLATEEWHARAVESDNILVVEVLADCLCPTGFGSPKEKP